MLVAGREDTPCDPTSSALSMSDCCAGCKAIVKTLSDAASTAGVFSSSQAAAYWSYHITRSGFFAIQGIAGAPFLMKGLPQIRSSLNGFERMLEDAPICCALSACSPDISRCSSGGRIAGVLAARAASTVTGRPSEDTGIRIESIIKAGLTGPMAEALAMYYQVRWRDSACQRQAAAAGIIPALAQALGQFCAIPMHYRDAYKTVPLSPPAQL